MTLPSPLGNYTPIVPPPDAEHQKQLYPLTPSQHAGLLHPVASDGRAVVVRRGRWDESEAWRPYELDAVLFDVAGEPDTYITQNSFSGHRRLVKDVLELGALYADLDYYTAPDLNGRAPEAVMEMALKLLGAMPEPSLVISSGRGIQLVWQHHPVGRKELPRWNDTQTSLYRSLRGVGADAAARDAARVFRLVGTINSKSGATVRTLHNTGQVHDFEKLVESMPMVEPERDPSGDGADVYDLRIERAKRGGFKGPRQWSEETLWEARLTDLQTLRRLRYGRQMGDFKDRWLFLAGVAMSWLVDSYEVLQRELMALAQEVGWLEGRRSRRKLKAVFDRIKMLARGETVEFAGRQWDPRFHFKNETISEWLEITPEEERRMVTLIGHDEYRRRDNESRRLKRRRAGVKSSREYNSERKAATGKKRSTARELKRAGLSTAEIAATMHISESTVRRLEK